MQESTLITIFIVLLVLLIPLLLSYLVYPDEKVSQPIPKKHEEKEKEKEPSPTKNKDLSFEDISAIFLHPKSTKEELTEGIEQLIKHHGKIQAKMGDLPHPDFKRYLKLIIELCNNPQADKNIIVLLDNKLRVKNPKYGLNIDEAVNKGIARRGF